jgi:hypothetical protein
MNNKYTACKMIKNAYNRKIKEMAIAQFEHTTN